MSSHRKHSQGPCNRIVYVAIPKRSAVKLVYRRSMQLFQPIRSLWSWSMQLPNLSGLSIGFTRTVFSSFFWSRHNLRNGVFRESTILILNFWSQKYHSSSKNENFEKSQNLTKIWNFHFCLITLMVHNLFFWWQNIPGKRQKWSFQLEYLFL